MNQRTNMYKVKFLFGITILSIAGVLLAGCGGPPEGLDSPRDLTDEERKTVIEVALNTPEAQKWLEQGIQYTTDMNWLAIVWDGKQWTGYYHIDTQWQTDPNLKNVPEAAVFYPYVLLKFMEPADWQIAIAVDLDREEPVLVHEYPSQKGPWQPSPN